MSGTQVLKMGERQVSNNDIMVITHIFAKVHPIYIAPAGLSFGHKGNNSIGLVGLIPKREF